MHPAFSVLFLTTLLGTGQGLFLALFAAEVAASIGAGAPPGRELLVVGGGVALACGGLGLFASIFHIGHPERGFRAFARWRTSWLSRELIALPLFMAGVTGWVAAQVLLPTATLLLGTLTAVVCIALFVCTGMIYACLRLLQEWATPLTPINYLLLGCASGATLATACAAVMSSPLTAAFARAAIVLTLAGAVTRIAALRRNRALRPRTTVQTAIGIPHPRIRQTAQGMMGGSYNTREFFHGVTPERMRAIRRGFLLLAFGLPVVLLCVPGLPPPMAVAAFVSQYLGLLAERWYFFADANHPQNLYYQAIS